MTDLAEITKGSDKQIAWATSIKAKMFERHDKALNADPETFVEYAVVGGSQSGVTVGLSREEMLIAQGFRDTAKSPHAAAFAAADAALAANDDARFWIDNRDSSIQMLAKQIVRAAQREAN